ncbi:MAG: YigZ family protein, partial [Clostridia bacterium]|nr:YigZ family protein [Clostridia bacterium]
VYYTVRRQTTAELSIKHSKFIAFCASVSDPDEADAFVRSIKKEYADATHAPYAYLLGERGDKSRASDDGEPSGTSGAPIFDAIKGEGLTDTVVVVVRYFGGIKLGTGGLTRAYGDSALAALRAAEREAYEKCTVFTVTCDYAAAAPIQNKAYGLGGLSLDTAYVNGVTLTVGIPVGREDAFISAVADVTSGKAVAVKTDERYCRMDRR